MNGNETINLPPPEAIASQIASLEDELKAMRRLLRASRAAAKAAEARQRRNTIFRELEKGIAAHAP